LDSDLSLLTSTALKEKSPFPGFVFVRSRENKDGQMRHAILDADLMVVEGNNKETSLTIKWEIEGAKDEAKDETIGSKGAGDYGILEAGAHLTIGIVPRNFLDCSDIKTDNNNLAEKLDEAVRCLRSMVDDLIGPNMLAHPKLDGQPQPGAATSLDPSAAMTDAVQRLDRLNKLLHDGHVLAAWEALLADPAVLLRAEHPVRPLPRARHPILHGTRGPWSLANGWSPDNELGRVRDRHVYRTTDTPPNRLAVQLAARVLGELRAINQDLNKQAQNSKDGEFGRHAYSELVDDLMQRATAVDRAPVFSEVSRTAPVGFDSPSLQMNRRCQPMLSAWTRLDRGLRDATDIPADEAVLRPLEKVHVLYELWCAQRLRALITEKLDGFDEKSEPPKSMMHYEWSSKLTETRVLLAATMTPHSDDAQGTKIEEDLKSRWSTKIGSTDIRIQTWAYVRQPDGLIAVKHKDADPWTVIVWDAKYRIHRDNKYLSSATYQAHAFRDALRVSVGGDIPVQPTWSLVLHPTPAAEGNVANIIKSFPKDLTDSPKRTLSESRHLSHPGIGFLRLRPSVEVDLEFNDIITMIVDPARQGDTKK
jgi:hypothetical protein